MSRHAKTQEQFIGEARAIHAGKYDYSRITYKNSRTPIEIICAKHGNFFQRPFHHLMRHGCPKCGIEAISNKNSFTKKANAIHKNKYDYSYVEYVNGHTKIKIKCPYHGMFNQRPHTHLTGAGCKKCAIIKISLTKTDFEERAQKIHRKTYGYSKVEYINSHKKVTITCLIHGDFSQTPNAHLGGQQGCPECAIGYGKYKEFDFRTNKNLREAAAIFYFIKINIGGISYNKIGITKRELKKRYSGFDFDIFFIINTTLYKAWCLEQKILKEFHSFRMKEKINFNGWSEILLTSHEIITTHIHQILGDIV